MTLLPGVDPFPSEPEARVRASSAWYTPPEVAARLAGLSAVAARRQWHVLEPSAGHGALIKPMLAEFAPAAIDAVDADARSCQALHDLFSLPPANVQIPIHVERCDYLSRPAPRTPYDLAVLNPPYEGGQDSAFVAKCMDESLRVVALLRLAMLESQRAHDRVWSRVEAGEWRLLELHPFKSRPVFLAGGEESGGGKTAFMAIKMSRVAGEDVAGTRFGWW